MGTFKVTLIHCVILLQHLSIVPSSGLNISSIKEELHDDSCDHNVAIQESVTTFVSEMISQHLPDCYMIQLRNQKAGHQYVHQARGTPTIDINLADVGSAEQTIQTINSNTGRGHIRFQRQCLIYLISLNGAQMKDLPNLAKIFDHHESQKRAKDSYIIVNEYINYEIAKEFLYQSNLKNYQHRLWTDIVPSDFHKPDATNSPSYSFKLHHYCYYCQEGKEGINSYEKVYNDVQEIKSLDEIFPDVTENLNGHTLRVTAPPAPPLVLIVPSKTNPKQNVIYGQQTNILTGIAGKYNFTYSLYSVPGGSTGSKLPNGSWNGVMGEILYGRADIGLVVATTYDRNAIADFTASVFYAFLVLVSTKPIPLFEWQAIFYPFKATAWLAVIVSTILTVYIYQFLHNQSLKLEVPARKKWKSKMEILEEIKLEKMTDFRSYYMTVGSLLEQGVPFEINTYPSRMYATFWMFFAIIITCAYRSKLFAFLISPTIETPPTSFEELSVSDYIWGMKSLGGVALLFITHSPLQYIRDVGEQMEIYTDKYTCLDKTFNGKFTCIIYRAYIDYMMEVRYWKLRHQFHISDFVTPPVGSAWALAKNSPLLPNFDKISFRIYEMGLADKYLIDYQVSFAKTARALAQASNSTDDTFDLNTNFKNDDDSGPRPLEMENLYGGFFILFFGVIVAFGFLITEKIKHNKMLKARKRVWMMMRMRMKAFRKNNGKNNKMSFNQLVRVTLLNTSDSV